MALESNHLKSWASGFIDGEGSFVIELKRHKDGRKADTYCRPRFTIQVRDDDKNALELVRQAIGFEGYLYKRKSRKVSTFGSVSRPTVELLCHSMNDIQALILHLDAYPLLAKKARDYTIWREAALVHLDKSLPSLQRQAILLQLREQLQSVRAYTTPYQEEES